MKTITTTLCVVLLTLSAVTSNAQSNRNSRPLQFSALPTSINFTESQLSSLFNAPQGKTVALRSAANASFDGPVTSNLVKYSNLQTVVIRLTAYNNSLFSISKQTEGNTINYVGRIINPAYADGFELKRSTNGTYQLVKIDAQNTLTDCSL